MSTSSITTDDNEDSKKTVRAKNAGEQSLADNYQESMGHKEQLFLICSTVGLSILGVIAFLISGQVTVVVAMNTPLLAILGRDVLSRQIH
jgi:hypothetical protein